MSKKNWIMVKRGLSEDPKHREAMGNRIWLYLHIIDRCDWDTGIVYDWRDEDEAEDMGLNPRTLERQRQELAELGYIECKQRKQGQDIAVYNWINPRNYSGGVINKKGTQIFVPLHVKGTRKGTRKGSNELRTPSLESGDQLSGGQGSAAPPPAVTAYREVARRFPDRELWSDVAGTVGESETDLTLWREVVHGYIACGWNKLNIKAMLEFFKRREVPSSNGSRRTSSEHPALAGMRMALEEMGQNGNG